ncbi:MAG: diacylglycerol kinase [Chitinophagaceae bacterium]|nr:diacylglycerol kinase [Rubrivivax sp.]
MKADAWQHLASAPALAREPQPPPPRAVPHNTPLHFVINGAAGNQNDAELLSTLAQMLGGAGRPFELHRARVPSDLVATAHSATRAAGAQGVVVAVGGDGTINTVAGAVMHSGATLGLLPRGTFNYFARAHGIALDTPGALQLLMTGRAHAVQAGRINDRLFLVNASLGLYPGLLEDREAFKQRYGRTRLVALWSGLMSLLREHRRLALRIEADDGAAREVKVSTLFVGNNRLQFEALGLPEAERTGHGALAALALRAFKPGELLWLALRGAMGPLGRVGEADDLSHFAFRRLSVRPRLPLPQRRVKVALDGEVTRLTAPLEFAVHERPLWLIKPEPLAGEDSSEAAA